MCYKEDGWPTTNALSTAHKPCPEGMVGSIDRTCSSIGLWEDVIDNCHQPMCPEDDEWPATPINVVATITCPLGYSGTSTRRCRSDQTWAEPDMSSCLRLHCTAEGVWPTTNTLTNATRPCGGNLLGEITRYCTVDQTWSEPDTSNCRPDYCVASGVWPNTPRNRTVSVECPSGFRGMRHRSCSMDAFWSEEDRSECLVAPQHSSLAVTPHTYFFTIRTRFNVDSTVYMLGQLPQNMAPSKQQMLESPFNATCYANTTCTVFVRNLRPLTTYNVYYWYHSHEGAEPLTSVSDMFIRAMTIDIVPFALVVEDCQGDYNRASAQVSMEERGGFVWCRAKDLEETPTVQWMKLSEPLHLQDGEERGIVTVPNLLPQSQYFIYCYAEDDYGDASTLSLADSLHVIWTLDVAPSWSTTIAASHVNSTVTATANRNGTLCCMWQADDAIPSQAEVERDGVCGSVVEGTGDVTMNTMDDTTFNVFCLFRTSTLLTFYSSTPSHTIHTPSRAPAITHVRTVATYTSLLLTFLSDRPGYLWCLATSPDAPAPTIADIKLAPRVTAVRDEQTEVLIDGLSKETEYRVSCWAESFEGLATTTALDLLTYNATTLSVPPTLSVNSFSLSYDAIHLVVATTMPSLVQCIVVNATAGTPTVSAFASAQAVPVNSIGEVTVDGLTENTSYKAFCLARDANGQVMTNTIASTGTAFTTPFNRHMLYVELLRLQELTATLSLLSSDDATVWCSVVHTNDLPPSASALKSTGVETSLLLGVPKALSLSGLNPNYPYSAYCYSESSRQLAQSNTIASTRVNVTTADYPVLEVSLSSLSGNPSYTSIDLDLSVSTLSTVFCRVRPVYENQLPPTESWIREGTSMVISTAHITHFLKMTGLAPATNYTLFCVGESTSNLTSLQPLESRSLGFMTVPDTTGPSVFITSASSDYTLSSQPVAVNITFSEAVLELNEEDLRLVNCRVLSFLRYSNQLYTLMVAPLAHGTLSLTVPAGKVMDLYGNGNVAASWSRFYPDAQLSVSLSEVGALYGDLSLEYPHEATAFCVVSTVPEAPASCAALASMSGAVNGTLNGTPLLLRMTPLAVNTTFYAFCCAEEANEVPMSNTIQSTQTLINLGWLDCPRSSTGVCSGHGTCTDGVSCQCAAGFYGDACDTSCPGLFLTTNGTMECGGHGVCDAQSLTCTCSEAIYGGAECSLLTMNTTTPSTGRSFVYATLTVKTSADLRDDYIAREQQSTLLRALATALETSPSHVGVRSWSVKQTRATTSQVTGVLAVDVATEARETTKSWLSDASRVSTLATTLTEAGFPTESVASQSVFAVEAGQTDRYSCYDGVLSPEETDVDCGGVCSKKCGSKQQCKTAEDCASGKCSNGRCMGNVVAVVVVLVVGVALLVIVVIVVFVSLSRGQEKEEKTLQEIEMAKQSREKRWKDLEKQDEEEEKELEMKELEMKVARAKAKEKAKAKKEMPKETSGEEQPSAGENRPAQENGVKESSEENLPTPEEVPQEVPKEEVPQEVPKEAPTEEAPKEAPTERTERKSSEEDLPVPVETRPAEGTAQTTQTHPEQTETTQPTNPQDNLAMTQPSTPGQSTNNQE